MATIGEVLQIALKHHEMGQLPEAERIYRQILQVDPNHPDALHYLGLLAHQVGRHETALEFVGRATSLRPNNAMYHRTLGVVHRAMGNLEESIGSCERALRIAPEYPEALECMAKAYHQQGKVEESIMSYERALRLRPNKSMRYALSTILPIIYRSADEVRHYRQRLIENSKGLLEEGFRIDPIKESMANVFHLAFQGKNDRQIHESIARLCTGSISACSHKREERVHTLERSGERSGNRIRIGFISRFFEAQTISKVWRGVIANLSRERFFVTVLSLSTSDDPIARLIKEQADRHVQLPNDLSLAREKIIDEDLDILFYTDIGMHPSTYALAVSRLAPVQCVTWGHPVTTGLATMDYFVSSELTEPEDAAEHYTEELVRLKTLGVHYYRPQFPLPRKQREDFGLPEGKHLYACLQTLFKLDPEYDLVLGEILRRDPRGILILSEGMWPDWARQLMQRFRSTIPDVVDRVLFVPWQSHDDYLRMINVIDVLLVPIDFGGGDTSFEALAFGIPIVTCPSKLLRGRITFGLYRILGVFDCVAKTPKEYVDIAARLGTDTDFRSKVSQKILDASDRLFEDMDAVRELERFLQKAVGSRQ